MPKCIVRHALGMNGHWHLGLFWSEDWQTPEDSGGGGGVEMSPSSSLFVLPRNSKDMPLMNDNNKTIRHAVPQTTSASCSQRSIPSKQWHSKEQIKQ